MSSILIYNEYAHIQGACHEVCYKYAQKREGRGEKYSEQLSDLTVHD